MEPGATWDFLLAFTVVMMAMPVLIFFAPQFGLIDTPDQRKNHSGHVPMVGGLAVFIGLFIVLGLRHLAVPGVREMLAGGLLLVAIGVVDDRNHIHPRYRFLMQIVASSLMIFSAGVLLLSFGQLLGPFDLPLSILAIPISVFCVVGVTNATNMIDGMDGLSSSVVLVALGALAVAACRKGVALSSIPEIPVIAGAVSAYWLFNVRLPWRSRAMVFFGDAGTLLLGFLVAWLMVRSSQGEGRIIAPVTALWLFAVPLMDTVFLMIRRKLDGQSMIEADRRHLHHAFLRSGRSVGTTLVIMVLASLSMAAAGLLMEICGLAEFWRFYAFMLLSGVYFVGMSMTWSQKRFLGRAIH